MGIFKSGISGSACLRAAVGNSPRIWDASPTGLGIGQRYEDILRQFTGLGQLNHPFDAISRALLFRVNFRQLGNRWSRSPGKSSETLVPQGDELSEQ
jgi:hypothetical protein